MEPFPYPDAIFVRYGAVHYLVLPDGRGYVVDGEGQLASLVEIFGPARLADRPPDQVVGSVTGLRENDLFKPLEIERYSGLDPYSPTVDETTDDDEISITLPPLLEPVTPDPTPANRGAPSLRAQVEGAEGDRTPGLAMPEISPYVSPTDPVEGGGEPAPPSAPTGGTPPQVSRPTDQPIRIPANAPMQRPTDQPIRIPANAPVTRPTDRPPPRPPNRPFERLTDGPVYSGTPAQRSTLESMRPSATLPPPSFPLLRRALERQGTDTSWLDRIER